ncbi:helix-turn-helix domain-containing protein, partial [Acinetobacter pittii]
SIEIGQLIRKKRIEKKITQEALALQCGIDRSYIGRIERGEVNLTVEKLYEIATALEVDMKELLP